jgi:hypothetical protein
MQSIQALLAELDIQVITHMLLPMLATGDPQPDARLCGVLAV